jgi:hypothetical protein
LHLETGIVSAFIGNFNKITWHINDPLSKYH